MVFLRTMVFSYVLLRKYYLRSIIRNEGLGRGTHDEINEGKNDKNTYGIYYAFHFFEGPFN